MWRPASYILSASRQVCWYCESGERSLPFQRNSARRLPSVLLSSCYQNNRRRNLQFNWHLHEDHCNQVDTLHIPTCTDRAKAMMGKHTMLIAHIRKVCPSTLWLHCRGRPSAKNIPDDVLSVLNDAVKLLNFIKVWPLNSRLYTMLCNEMGGKFKALLLLKCIGWSLWAATRISSVFWRQPVSFGLQSVWRGLAITYLAYIFSVLNEQNLSL